MLAAEYQNQAEDYKESQPGDQAEPKDSNFSISDFANLDSSILNMLYDRYEREHYDTDNSTASPTLKNQGYNALNRMGSQEEYNKVILSPKPSLS